MAKKQDTCPVCGKIILPDSEHSSQTYQGKRYKLCCPMCLALFQDNPEIHVKPPFGMRLKPPEERPAGG